MESNSKRRTEFSQSNEVRGGLQVSMDSQQEKYRHMKKKDLHVHTQYCKHTEGRMEEYVIKAIEQDLDEIGFLAHAEAGIQHPRILWLQNGEYDLYWQEGTVLKSRYGGSIKITLGLELGLNPNSLEELQIIVKRHPWDRVGLSYHQLRDADGYLNICSRFSIPRIRKVDNLQFTKRYYGDLRDHISVIKPEMLCHLDVVRKHMHDCSSDLEVQQLIRELLLEMKKEGVRLEVNTAGYDTVGAPYPAPWIIREAVAMGIDLVLCSDSHSPEHVGRHFDDAVQYIEDSLAPAPPGSRKPQEMTF